MKSALLFSFLFTSLASAAPQIRTYHLPLPAELYRADIHVLQNSETPRAVLVLCPGQNGDGKDMISAEWLIFARTNRLGVAAISFASSKEDLMNGRGYFYPARGAGQLLSDTLKEVFGGDLPILFFGFSGGAQFAARFTDWKPERVLTWCAYTPVRCDKPTEASINPPGIVACGEDDAGYGAALGYFSQGRALGKPWSWISLAKTGHEQSLPLNEFARAYFSAILQGHASAPEWWDVDLKKRLSPEEAKANPTLACWLPSRQVAGSWLTLHQP